MGTGLAEKQRSHIEDYQVIEDAAERFSAIVHQAAAAPALEEAHRAPENLVPGCVSRVWLVGWRDPATGGCEFRADAEAPTVKGVAVLLARLYSGATPEEVLAVEPEIVCALQIDRQLSPTRLKGLAHIRRRFREIAETLVQNRAPDRRNRPPLK